MAHLDGKPVTTDDVLPLALTSYGHFTTMRADADHRIRGLSLHMDRLVRDCRTVWGAGLDTGRVRQFVRQALEGQRGPCMIRVTVYDPAVEVGHPADADQPQALVTVRPAGAMPPPPLRAMSVPYERDLPQVKHCGLFGALHIRRAAQFAGFDDALFIGPDGYVSEGATWNVGFIDDDGTVVWPQAPVLPGITMRLLQQQVAHRIAPVTLAQAKGMRAAFATNTGIGVRALTAVDDAPLAVEDPVLSTLREAYLSIPGEEP
ncbi:MULTISPECIES: aminotransferase class IV family protein [Streptomyces]|nr:aminotransferase class IV family protein [Streptomyces nigrescens]MEE4419069.1 aminotransferase class IV family protein [Streptomyces sp. DSM 41528]